MLKISHLSITHQAEKEGLWLASAWFHMATSLPTVSMLGQTPVTALKRLFDHARDVDPDVEIPADWVHGLSAIDLSEYRKAPAAEPVSAPAV